MNINRLIELPYIPPNRTSRFLFPSIGLLPSSLETIRIDGKKYDANDILKLFGYRNCYLSDKNHYENFDHSLTLLFNPTQRGLQRWHFFYDYYSRHHSFIKDYDIDLGVVALIMDMEPKYKPIKGKNGEIISNLREFFINGEYSKFPINYAREFFIRHDGTRSIHTKEMKICSKQESYREELMERLDDYVSPYWEYEEKPIMEQEILDYEEIKKKIKEKI